MVRRSVNSFAAQQKRLPHRAIYYREDVLRPSDKRRLEAMIIEIADDAEFMTHAGSHKDGWFAQVIRFDCPVKAKAMQAWLDKHDIAKWPAPQKLENYPQLKVGG
jgi:hypothetical protein